MTITCPVCGTDCEPRRVCEATTIHECPHCEPRESRLHFLPPKST